MIYQRKPRGEAEGQFSEAQADVIEAVPCCAYAW